MNKLLSTLAGYLLLSCLSLASAQGVTQLADIPIYQGNPYSLTLWIPAPDTLLSSSAMLYASKGSRAVETALQPSVLRSGRRVIISWSGAQTRQLSQSTFLEIAAGSVVRYQALVLTSKAPIRTTTPNSLTVMSPVVVISASPPGSISEDYKLSGTPPSGFIINHNKTNPLVRGTFYREDTRQPDTAWRIQIEDDNNVRVTGPPGEYFYGRLTLEFISQPTSNQ